MIIEGLVLKGYGRMEGLVLKGYGRMEGLVLKSLVLEVVLEG